MCPKINSNHQVHVSGTKCVVKYENHYAMIDFGGEKSM